jgi:hypothetical protein
MNYDNASPIPNKWLQPDGSITTFDGTIVIQAANQPGVNYYNAQSPIPNKTLNPNNSVTTFPQAGAGVTTPAGPQGAVQFNDTGGFNGTGALTADASGNLKMAGGTLTLSGASSIAITGTGTLTAPVFWYGTNLGFSASANGQMLYFWPGIAGRRIGFSGQGTGSGIIFSAACAVSWSPDSPNLNDPPTAPDTFLYRGGPGQLRIYGTSFSPGSLALIPWQAATAATNYSPGPFIAGGTYWNGTASANDAWSIQQVFGTGTNPTSQLQILHTGTTGATQTFIGSNIAIDVAGTIPVPSAASFSVSNNGTSLFQIAPPPGGSYLVGGTNLLYMPRGSGGGGYLTIPAGGMIGITGASAFGLGYCGGPPSLNTLIINTALNVNQFSMSGGTAGISPKLVVQGSDANIGMIFGTKGTGTINLGDITARNSIIIAPSATGTGPVISSAGVDTNIDINIDPAGTGNVNLVGPTNINGNLMVTGISTLTGDANISGNVTALGALGINTTPGYQFNLKNAAAVNSPCFMITKSTGLTPGAVSITFNEPSNYVTLSLGGASIQGFGGSLAMPSMSTTGGSVVSFAPQIGSVVPLSLTNQAATVTAHYFNVTQSGQTAGNLFNIDQAGNTNVGGVFTAGVGGTAAFQVIASAGTFTQGFTIRPAGTSGIAALQVTNGFLLGCGPGGVIQLGYGGTGASVTLVVQAAAYVNQFSMSGGTAGISPKLIVQGNDTNINLSLQPKGTGALNVSGVQAFTNNAAAIAGGLIAGSIYRTGADPDVLCIVH